LTGADLLSRTSVCVLSLGAIFDVLASKFGCEIGGMAWFSSAPTTAAGSVLLAISEVALYF
jgi:hypothetical protein